MRSQLHYIREDLAASSQSFTDKELYTDIQWFRWSATGEKGNYIFSEEGDYIYRRGNFVRHGHWKSLKDGHHLLLEYQDLEGHAQHLMYELVYLDEDVLILELPEISTVQDPEWLILLEEETNRRIRTEEELIDFLTNRPERSGLFSYLAWSILLIVLTIVIFSLC